MRDQLCLGDVAELAAWDMQGKPLWVVKHPPSRKVPLQRPRSWTSLMLLDCAKLQWWTPTFVEGTPDARLMRLQDFGDDQIGELPPEWNYIPQPAQIDITLPRDKNPRFADGLTRPGTPRVGEDDALVAAERPERGQLGSTAAARRCGPSGVSAGGARGRTPSPRAAGGRPRPPGLRHDRCAFCHLHQRWCAGRHTGRLRGRGGVHSAAGQPGVAGAKMSQPKPTCLFCILQGFLGALIAFATLGLLSGYFAG